jgi:hypothetical protein
VETMMWGGVPFDLKHGQLRTLSPVGSNSEPHQTFSN